MARISLRAVKSRVDRLATRICPPEDLKAQARRMSEEELEIRIEEAIEEAVGPLAGFQGADALLDLVRTVSESKSWEDPELAALLRELWERARWFSHHAAHGPFQLGPRWCHRPLLSCVCGGHLKVYRGLIPADLGDRITEDDEPRTEFYYPMYPAASTVSRPEPGKA